MGWNSGRVERSYSTGSIAGVQVSGLVGINYGTIVDSYSWASVHGNNVVSGLVGTMGQNAIITRRYSTGAVSAETVPMRLHGVVERYTSPDNLGGLIGHSVGPFGIIPRDLPPKPSPRPIGIPRLPAK